MEEAWQKRSIKTFLKGWSGEGHEQHLSQLHQAATPERDSSAEINAGRTQQMILQSRGRFVREGDDSNRALLP